MLPKRYSHRESEPKWQRYWEEKDLFRFDAQPDGPVYSVDTPPPTVSGDIHIGHVYSYTQAEMVARYWRMKGRRVFLPFGFDDNGLPTERLVERELGIKASDIDRREFVRLCQETAGRYEQRFKELWKSLGFSADWTLEYSTIDRRCRRISQLSFLDVFEKGGVYQDTNPNAWCTECMTSVAQAEVETAESQSWFNYVAFGTDADEELVIATTRPELIPACVAVFVHPEDEQRRHLVGRQAIVPLIGRRVPIMSDPAVDLSLGTAAVMCCTFGDQQDIKWWREHRLDLREMIGRDGRVAEGYGRYSGMTCIEARAAILDDLNAQGHLRARRPVTHQVACHERCGTPIEYLSSRQWFIRIMDKKDRFLEAADQIDWHPPYMKHRYVDWVNSLQWDWCISRQRYYGVPFPVWYCSECGSVRLAAREELPVDPLETSPKDRCECGSTDFVPERDVMDTWATSSVTPFINAGWDGGTAFGRPLIPMDLRPQAHDIIRTWAFYTIVKTVYHTGSIPWRNVMVSGFVMAKKGEKLSKSKDHEAMSPQSLISTYSADVVRLWTSTGRLGTDIVFVEEELRNNQRLPVKLWNAAKLVLPHLREFRRPVDCGAYQWVVTEPMDRWLVQKACAVSKEVGAAFEAFEIHRARELLDSFFWSDFCDNYLEIVKERLYKPAVRGEAARESARATLYAVLLEILKMYSVFAPHIAEEIYQAYYREQEGCESVQLLRWGMGPAVVPGRAAAEGGAGEADGATAMGDWSQAGDGTAEGRTAEVDGETAEAGTPEADDSIARGGVEFLKIVSIVRKFKSERGLSQGAEVDRVIVRCSAENYEFLNAAYLDLKAVTRSRELILAVSEHGDESGHGNGSGHGDESGRGNGAGHGDRSEQEDGSEQGDELEQGDESEQARETKVEVSVG